MCNGQRLVKSLQKVIISMTSRILAKSREYKSNEILSLWSPPRNPTIASGDTPIGSAGRAPNEKERNFLFTQVMTRKDKTRSKYFWAYTQIFLTIASGATPIGSAGRAPNKNEIINYARREIYYRTHIGVNYRLHCQKTNIGHCYSLIHSHREGFAISRGTTTRRFWVLNQPNKAHDKIMILKPCHRDKKFECHDCKRSWR
jgi:hypothetical protein